LFTTCFPGFAGATVTLSLEQHSYIAIPSHTDYWHFSSSVIVQSGINCYKLAYYFIDICQYFKY